MNLTVWLILSELAVITAGIVAVLIVGPDRELRRLEHEQELAEIDAFLNAIRAVTKRDR